ncbi:MAG: histidine ammonia-lyase [Halobacteriaceae archaeon]
MMTDSITIDGESLSPFDVEAVARAETAIKVPESVRKQVRESREHIENIIESGKTVYGVNTGFGSLVQEHISSDQIQTLQHNLLRSHSVGTGDELSIPEVRAMLVTRINALVKGYSGIRECVIDLLIAMLNEGVHPVVPEKGSLGASGDLAPLAHLGLVVIGEGEAYVDGDRLPGDEALNRRGLEAIELEAKEGLALINGTQLTAGLGALIVCDAKRVIRAADMAGALTTEVTMSTTATADLELYEVRPHEGHKQTAQNIQTLTADSEIISSHRDCQRVQDAYSIRCIPQVHGAVRDVISHLEEVVTTELNSATDNPLVFDATDVDDRASGTEQSAVLSGGNFHGEPLALPLDYLTNALTELGAISERRVDRMLNPEIQEDHLPPFLTENSGLQSGLMIAQYTAADLVSTNRSMGSPSTDTIPVSGNQEDHVSMSAQCALQTRDALKNTLHVIAIELVCGTQALDFIEEYDPGIGTGAMATKIREYVSFLDEDRPMSEDMDTIRHLITGDELINHVEAKLNTSLN